MRIGQKKSSFDLQLSSSVALDSASPSHTGNGEGHQYYAGVGLGSCDCRHLLCNLHRLVGLGGPCWYRLLSLLATSMVCRRHVWARMGHQWHGARPNVCRSCEHRWHHARPSMLRVRQARRRHCNDHHIGYYEYLLGRKHGPVPACGMGAEELGPDQHQGDQSLCDLSAVAARNQGIWCCTEAPQDGCTLWTHWNRSAKLRHALLSDCTSLAVEYP